MVNLVNSRDDGQHQNCSSSLGLGWGGHGLLSLVEEPEDKWGQSGEENKMWPNDHHFMWAHIWFKFDLNWVWLFPKVLKGV